MDWIVTLVSVSCSLKSPSVRPTVEIDLGKNPPPPRACLDARPHRLVLLLALPNHEQRKRTASSPTQMPCHPKNR